MKAMSTEIKVAQRMVGDFKTFSPINKVDKAITDLTASGAKYCIVMTPEGEPLALATPEQLQAANDMNRALHDILDKLPTAVVVEQDQTMDDVVISLSSVLIGAREIPGVVVFHKGAVTGVVPRRVIAEHASFGIKTRGIGTGTIEGDPLSGPRRYRCPQGDHEESVTFYDRNNPPRCPTHHIILVRKV
jgi:hypothetical protein